MISQLPTHKLNCSRAMVTDRDAFSEVVTQAVARLVSARLFGEALTVSLPISYPSGAFAGVKVSLSGDSCLVSDSALGLREAEMACIGDFYDSAAKEAVLFAILANETLCGGLTDFGSREGVPSVSMGKISFPS